MRHLIPCFACGLCAVHTPIGFTSHASMLCTARNDEAVSMSDGCTLGEPGKPITAVTEYDIDLNADATVNGFPYE